MFYYIFNQMNSSVHSTKSRYGTNKHYIYTMTFLNPKPFW